MKILLTGGGTGGHFYPIIAVAEEINNIAKENRLLRPEIYYMSTDPYNEGLLFENNITFEKVSAGKIRKSLSITNIVLNFIDLFKTFFGVLTAIRKMFIIYPDVVFGKGGYASYPALFAARLLRIPVVIHESDSSPGKVNRWAGKFAEKIAVSYPNAVQYFKPGITAYTGNPIRREVKVAQSIGADKFFNFNPNVPTVLILGGSQGAQTINEIIIDALPDLVKKYQIIHQTGKNNIEAIIKTKDVLLQDNPHKDRYRPYPYLDILTLRMAAGMSNIIISRAGSTIFEIASWAKPSIIIPIPEPTSHDQRKNAYAYARSGAAVVIEEKNLASGVLISEIDRIVGNPEQVSKMSESAKAFARDDSARLIADQIMGIAMSHQNG